MRIKTLLVLWLVLICAIAQAQHNLGIWLKDDEIKAIPASGPHWDYMKKMADKVFEPADLSRRNKHNAEVLAAAIVSVRLDSQPHRDKVVAELKKTMSAPINQNEVLAACRRLGTYAIALDIVGVDKTPYKEWFRTELRRVYTGSSGGGGSVLQMHEKRPQNFGTHAFASRVAIDLILDDKEDLARAVKVHKAFIGHEGTWPWVWYGPHTWHAVPGPNQPPINPVGATINGIDVSGVLVDDIQRGGDFHYPITEAFKRDDGFMYTFEALQGLVVGTTLLCRNGYPDAHHWGNKAILRAWYWPLKIGNGQMLYDNAFQKHLMEYLYGEEASFITIPSTITENNVGKNMGYTAWSNMGRRHKVELPTPPPPPPPVDPCEDLRTQLEMVKAELKTLQDELVATKTKLTAAQVEIDGHKQRADNAISLLNQVRDLLFSTNPN